MPPRVGVNENVAPVPVFTVVVPLTAVHAAAALEDRADPQSPPPWDIAYLDEAGQKAAIPAWLGIADDLAYQRENP